MKLVVRKGETYEAWPSEFSCIPPRSYLYSPEPLDVGTEWVESFATYLTRLLDEHLLSPDDFISALALHDERASRLLSNGMLSGLRNWVNGQGKRSSTLVECVSVATLRSELNLLTCLPFESIFQIQCRGSIAYCAICYEEWRNAGKTVYEPLLWAIKAVTMCPRHKSPLRETCPNCGRKLWALTVRSHSGFCWNCQHWLGKSSNAPKRLTTAQAEALRDSCAVAKLLCESGKLEPAQLATVFFENTSALIEIFANGNLSEVARGCGIGRRAVENLTSETSQVPTIETALKVSDFLGVELAALLQPGFSETLRTKRYPARTKRVSAKEIKLALEDASKEVPAPPLTAVAQRLGLKRETRRLFAVDRGLCATIIERFRRAGKRTAGGRKKGRRVCSPEMIQDALLTASKMQNPPSLSRIAVSLGYCAKGIAVIKQMYPELCRAIVEKRKSWQRARKQGIERALRQALREIPTPSISELSRRLGTRTELLQRYFPELCRKIVARRRAFHDGVVARLPRLLKAVLREVPPPSLKSVVERSGVSLHLIHKLFPDEAKLIAKRHLDSRRRLIDRRREGLLSSVRRIMCRLREKGVYPSNRRVITLLPRGVASWKEQREAIATVREELGRSVAA